MVGYRYKSKKAVIINKLAVKFSNLLVASCLIST